MSFSVYSQIGGSDDHKYKLMQLPKELLEYLKTPDNVLEFKLPLSRKNHLVLCTESETYTVRQMNHSNTQLVVEDLQVPAVGRKLMGLGPDSSSSLLAVGLCSYLYELTPSLGEIETAGLPLYDGTAELLVGSVPLSVESLMQSSPIARTCFQSQWHALCGSEIDGIAVILSPDFVTNVLYTIIAVAIAEKWSSFTLEEMAPRLASENSKFTRLVLETIAGKFCECKDNELSLNRPEIAKWFGIMSLKKLATATSDKDLLLQWKSSLPPFFNALLDLKVLRGHFYRPLAGRLQYLNKETLSPEIHARIKDMFKITKDWDYDEFLPYVEEFIPATKKADAVILKYAKKKRMGKLFVVCPR
ncbi:hypothetical protein PUMCH_002607 [Australozyma saopauloensis]|uniref:Sister chromatid cohesion protein DCC1 n=1 Tax=Australozyma saopauloensis TaxID=291208 RepID=A0AAX4HAE5_9ASCO|nr:hypothetical protein PUMCH_002607 [[Candida] saopauloensis]